MRGRDEKNNYRRVRVVMGVVMGRRKREVSVPALSGSAFCFLPFLSQNPDP
jgi:hypothetical protein